MESVLSLEDVAKSIVRSKVLCFADAMPKADSQFYGLLVPISQVEMPKTKGQTHLPAALRAYHHYEV